MPQEKQERSSRLERRRQHIRAEILAAARELLLEVGPAELSLRQVARRADFSPAGLYNYFASKGELLAALFAESFERLWNYISRVSPSLPPDERVVQLGLAYMEFGRKNPMDLRCILLATAEDLPPTSGKELAMRVIRLIGDTFREGVEQGVFVASPGFGAPEMAYGTWALVHGLVSVAGVDLEKTEGALVAAPERVLREWVSRMTRSAGCFAG